MPSERERGRRLSRGDEKPDPGAPVYLDLEVRMKSGSQQLGATHKGTRQGIIGPE